MDWKTVSVAENVPEWPTAYHAIGTINVPYDEISEPFEAWYNNVLGSSRIDYYNGNILAIDRITKK